MTDNRFGRIFRSIQFADGVVKLNFGQFQVEFRVKNSFYGLNIILEFKFRLRSVFRRN